MSKQKFTSKLSKAGSWTICIVPFDVKKKFGTASHCLIKGTIENFPIKGISLMPMGGGVHCFPVKAEIRKAIRKDLGDSVKVEIEKDLEKQIVEIPAELKEAFKASKEAKKMYDGYSASMRKEYCRYIGEGKKKETREKRAVDMVLKLEKKYFETKR